MLSSARQQKHYQKIENNTHHIWGEIKQKNMALSQTLSLNSNTGKQKYHSYHYTINIQQLIKLINVCYNINYYSNSLLQLNTAYNESCLS